jgi:hypothetical protein
MTRNRGRLYSLGLGAAIPLWAAMATMGEAAFNPLHALSGRWEARGPAAGLGRAADCRANSYEYRISADGRHVELLASRGGKTERERFVVMHVANDRVLLLVEGEPGRTEYGGPIVWWAVFDGHNRFRWHRDDWPRNSMTALEWRRCW